MSRHTRLARYIDGDDPQRYRELIIDNVSPDKTHKLSLVFNDTEFDDEDQEDREYIVIPLGKTASVPKDSPRPTCPEEFPNFTVPLILKRYAATDYAKKDAKELRQGWLYLFCNGYLWRELKIDPGGLTRDVNLRRYQGRDERLATGEADVRVIVPWKINNQRQTIEIAYSEVQWSWARINALGGMNPDTDYEIRLAAATALASDDPATCAERRKARMQDISDELEQWIVSEGEETDNIQHIKDVTAKIAVLDFHQKSALPVVFVEDPLGTARDLMATINREVQALGRQVESIGKKPFYDSAILAYSLFYEPKVAGRMVETGRATHGKPRSKRFHKNVFGECGDKTNRAQLEELLEVTARKQRRQTIRQQQDQLTHWLNGCDAQGQPLARSGAIDCNTALIDYFSSHGELYAAAWLVFNELIASISLDPSTLDGPLDLEADRGIPDFKADPRIQYRLSLLDESHPLNPMLFPSEAQAPVRSEGAVDLNETVNDGLGTFRPDALAAITVPGLFRHRFAGQQARRLAGLVNQSITDLCSHYTKLKNEADVKKISHSFDGFIRLAKAANPEDLEGLLITQINEIGEERIILEGKASELRFLTQPQAAATLNSEKKKIRTNGKVKDAITIMDNAGDTVASTSIAQLSSNKGVLVGSHEALESAPLSKLKMKEAVAHLKGEVITIPRTSPVALKLNVPELAQDVATEIKAGAIRAMRVTLPPVVILFEIWNLGTVKEAYRQAQSANKTKELINFLNASTDLAFATLEGIQVFANKNTKLHTALTKNGAKFLGIRIGLVPFVGMITGVFSCILSLRDAFYAVDYNDDDAAIGHTIMASGFLLSSVALLGTAFGEGSLLFALSPYLWAFAGLVLIGVTVVALCDDTPIETWAANGPFSLEGGSEELSYLRTDPAIAYTVLRHALFSPKLAGCEITTPLFVECKRGDFEVTVTLPRFRLNQDILDLRASWEVHAPRGSGMASYQQQSIAPYQIQQLADDHGQVTGFKYFYKPPTPYSAASTWRAKARLILPDGTILPDGQREHSTGRLLIPEGLERPQRQPNQSDAEFELAQEQHEQKLNKIDPDIPGWVYNLTD